MKRLVLSVGPWVKEQRLGPGFGILVRESLWRVTGVGAAPIVFTIKSAAVAFARERCKERLSVGGLAQMVVHRADGRIHYESTYGADPRRSRG